MTEELVHVSYKIEDWTTDKEDFRSDTRYRKYYFGSTFFNGTLYVTARVPREVAMLIRLKHPNSVMSPHWTELI